MRDLIDLETELESSVLRKYSYFRKSPEVFQVKFKCPEGSCFFSLLKSRLKCIVFYLDDGMGLSSPQAARLILSKWQENPRLDPTGYKWITRGPSKTQVVVQHARSFLEWEIELRTRCFGIVI